MYRQAGESYSTAFAQHFYQTKNFSVHPSDRLPFPLEFHNHNAVLENHSGRATRPRKNLMTSLRRLDTIPACDIQPSFDSNDALCIYASCSKNHLKHEMK